MKWNYTLLIVLVVAGTFYLWRYKRAPVIDLAMVEVHDEFNRPHSLDSILSDSSVVLFYASWCGPCLKELRTLKTNVGAYESAGIRFYCISDDSPEKIAVMRANMPSSMRFLHTASLKEIGIYSIPAAYLIRNHSIIEKYAGAPDWENTSKIIETFKDH
jgi:peroxiredoxin